MRHAKFLALNGNAIALWDEIKDYCDEHHTDGLVPTEAFKTFRFSGKKSMELLTASCGQKPDGTPYAPLLEPHVVGWKMHDFLDHNDCREEVLARFAMAESRREEDKARKALARAAKKAKSAKSPCGQNADASAPCPQEIRSISVPEPVPATPVGKEHQQGGAPTAPRPMAPIHDRSHRNHAHCGRVCLHASLFGEFVRRRNHDNADMEIRDWALAVEREWGPDGPRAHVEPGDPFDFWKARYSERWPAESAKASSVSPVRTELSPAMAERIRQRESA